MCHGKIQNQCTRRRKAVCPVPRLLQDDVVPNFHIPPFLPLSRCDLVYFNPMAYGTQHDTKSVHHPVVYLRSHRLRLTRLQVITEKVNLKTITGTLPKRPNQIRNWHPQLSTVQNHTSQSARGKRSSLVRRLTWLRNPRGFQVKVRDGGSPVSIANNSCGKTEGWSKTANDAGSKS
jgi:hypothetical protein